MSTVEITDYMNLKIIKNRWTLVIIATTPGEAPQKWVASADTADTGGSGLYFATEAQWLEDHPAED